MIRIGCLFLLSPRVNKPLISAASFIAVPSHSTRSHQQIQSAEHSKRSFTSSPRQAMSTMSSSSDTTKQCIRVVSYNLLSSHLADPEFHTKCQAEHLDANHRFPKIIAKLQAQIDANASADLPVVFCLQEVSHDWAKQLHVFFANNGYHFVTALYGRNYSGYMGIGTAYPTNYYNTKYVDLCRLADVRPGGWPRPPKVDDESNQTPGLLSRFVISPILQTAQYVSSLASSSSSSSSSDTYKVQNPWEKSQYRHNQFIAIQLERKDQSDNNHTNKPASSIWVANYHMPCAFREPAVMTIHCDLVAHRIQSLAAKGDHTTSKSSSVAPFILAGDFNITPDGPHYQLMTTGSLPPDATTTTTASDSSDLSTKEQESPSPYPPIRYGTKWKPSLSKMKSAYALHNPNDKEPNFTNYAYNGALADDNHAFIDTLDYIFLSQNHDWVVKDVESLKHRDDDNVLEEGPYPNQEQPSDHVLIAATLEV